MARCCPSSQRLFFSLECSPKVFSLPLQRATTGPQSHGSADGVEPSGREAYVTQQAQEASQWEREGNVQGEDRETGRRRRKVSI